jgi:hypothetical protein
MRKDQHRVSRRSTKVDVDKRLETSVRTALRRPAGAKAPCRRRVKVTRSRRAAWCPTRVGAVRLSMAERPARGRVVSLAYGQRCVVRPARKPRAGDASKLLGRGALRGARLEWVPFGCRWPSGPRVVVSCLLRTDSVASSGRRESPVPATRDRELSVARSVDRRRDRRPRVSVVETVGSVYGCHVFRNRDSWSRRAQVKYHCFHSFFTYSVERSRGRKGVVSGVEAQCARPRGRARARSALKTVSGGGFEWGGTCVKR